MSKIYVVGLGPGNIECMTQEAVSAIADSDTIVGYKTYVDLVQSLIEDKEVISSGMRKEIDRCTIAVTCALQGKTVALISSGDSGVYGMAGAVLEVVEKSEEDIEVEVIPGVTAANAAAACLGAPLMHDFVVISLSDLLTDWELIKKRLHCAGEGDFVVCLYNPKSKGRPKHIEEARRILLQYKEGTTPVGIVRNAKRDGQQVDITTLDEMLNKEINMFTMVIIGNKSSYIKNNRIITPRGYKV